MALQFKQTSILGKPPFLNLPSLTTQHPAVDYRSEADMDMDANPRWNIAAITGLATLLATMILVPVGWAVHRYWAPRGKFSAASASQTGRTGLTQNRAECRQQGGLCGDGARLELGLLEEWLTVVGELGEIAKVEGFWGVAVAVPVLYN